jgi:hypothetical protein
MAGEIAGADLVWREGMANWATLDSVLQASGAGTSPPGLESAKKAKGKPVLVWGLVAGAVLILALVCIGAITALKMARKFRQEMESGSQPAGPASVDVAEKEVSVGTNTLTEQAVRKRARDFRVRQYAEGYRKYGNHSAPWDADAVQLINTWIAYLLQWHDESDEPDSIER